MPNSDQLFKLVAKHFPPPSRFHAKVEFRRVHRQYMIFQGRLMHKYPHPTSYCSGSGSGSGFDTDTDTDTDMPKNLVSERIAITGGRLRRIKKYQQPRWASGAKGRPPNLPLEFFVSQLAFIWAKAHQQRTTIRHKGNQISPTAYEEFMTVALNGIGVHSVRKYLEIHSAARSKWRSATIY
jgi:hypothetical protein